MQAMLARTTVKMTAPVRGMRVMVCRSHRMLTRCPAQQGAR